MTRLAWTSSPAADLARFSAAATDWDRLNDQRQGLPFLSAAAMNAALAAFGDGRERLFTARQDGHVVAMFLLVPQGRVRWVSFQPSQIPLGGWVAERALALERLADSLLHDALRWSPALSLSITQIDPLIAARPDDGPTTEHSDYIDTGWVDIEGSFADYWAARGKNLRQNLRKQRNKLATEGIATEMRLLTSSTDMAPALARYGALESAGWKAGGGTSIHADNAQGRFYTQLFTEAAERGEARIYEYLFDGRTVASNLCLLRGGVLTVLKTTYDESIKLYSPASMLREEELQSFFAGGEIRRVEYYGRLMEWHTKLTDRKRTLHHLTVYRWPWLKTLAAKRRAARAAAEPSTPDASPPAVSPAPNAGAEPSAAKPTTADAVGST